MFTFMAYKHRSWTHRTLFSSNAECEAIYKDVVFLLNLFIREGHCRRVLNAREPEP